MARLPALVLLGPLIVLGVTLLLLVELADLGGHGVRPAHASNRLSDV